jgi:hypothetical protein
MYTFFSLWFCSSLDFGRCFSFLMIHTEGRTPWTGDQSIARPLPTHRTTQTQNKRTQTTMPRVEFEPTIPVFEQAKTVHAFDRAATVIGRYMYTRTYRIKICSFCGPLLIAINRNAKCRFCVPATLLFHSFNSATAAKVISFNGLLQLKI